MTPVSPGTARSSARVRARRRRVARRRRALGAGIGILVLVLVVVLLASGGGRVAGAPPGGVAREAHSSDPFSYATSQAAQFTARAAAGNANVLFTKSPDGALATAARVAAWRGAIDRAVRGTNISPALLEGLVFVESAGRPDAIAGTSVDDAAGLTQILAATGTSLLGMHIDLAASQSLVDQIDNGATGARLDRLQRRLAAADPRFDPDAALAATVTYLQDAERTFGREDLAFESYHMGIGNLQGVLRLYGAGTSVPYVQLYFDTGPQHHAAAFTTLQGFGDDSCLYWWRILGAVAIMREYRSDRAALGRAQALALADDAGASILHPPGSPARFADPRAVSDAYRSRALVPLPSNATALGLAYDSSMGASAKAVHAPASLYRGLAPVALHELLALAAEVRSLAGGAAPLRVAATVQDDAYQQAAGVSEPLAATGYEFDIERSYRSGAQAVAFQQVLDRLQSLDLIRWVAAGDVIQVTVASDAGAWRG